MSFQQVAALLQPLTFSSVTRVSSRSGRLRFPKFPNAREWARQHPKARPHYAAERARLMFGCYPHARANDPDTYIAAVAAVLGEYPERVIARATDPCTGVARKLKVLPSIAELSDACERALLEIWAPLYRAAGDAME
jgi:hypothetical protein